MTDYFKQPPYLPGQGRKPKLPHSKEPLTAGNFSSHPHFKLGLHFHNQGYYWEAHEVLEPIWRNSKPPFRNFLKAIIQFSAAHLKLRQGDTSASDRLLKRSAELLSSIDPRSLSPK